MTNRFFELVVREHQNAVFGLLFSLLRDRQQAEDLTQETFLVLHRKIDDVDISRPVLPWLLTTAKNLALNARRHGAVEHRLFLKGDEIESFWERIGHPSLGTAWEERLEALRDCRESLPSPQKEAIDLFYTEEKDCGEIAKRVDAATATVYQRLTRARNALRQCIEQKLEATA